MPRIAGEPGVILAERPLMEDPANAARVFAEWFGESDCEVFKVAILGGAAVTLAQCHPSGDPRPSSACG